MAHHITKENAREMAKRAVEVRRNGKLKIQSMREWAIAYRDIPSPDNPHVSQGAAVIRAVYLKGMEGDVRAAQFLADLMGETENRVVLKELPKLIDDIV